MKNNMKKKKNFHTGNTWIIKVSLHTVSGHKTNLEGDSHPYISFWTIRYWLDNTDGERFQQNGLGNVFSSRGGLIVVEGEEEGGREVLMWVASLSLWLQPAAK